MTCRGTMPAAMRSASPRCNLLHELAGEDLPRLPPQLFEFLPLSAPQLHPGPLCGKSFLGLPLRLGYLDGQVPFLRPVPGVQLAGALQHQELEFQRFDLRPGVLQRNTVLIAVAGLPFGASLTPGALTTDCTSSYRVSSWPPVQGPVVVLFELRVERSRRDAADAAAESGCTPPRARPGTSRPSISRRSRRFLPRSADCADDPHTSREP